MYFRCSVKVLYLFRTVCLIVGLLGVNLNSKVSKAADLSFLNTDVSEHLIKIKIDKEPFSALEVYFVDRISSKHKVPGDMVNLKLTLKSENTLDSVSSAIMREMNSLLGLGCDKVFSGVLVKKDNLNIQATLILNSALNLRVRKTFSGNVVLYAFKKTDYAVLHRLVYT